MFCVLNHHLCLPVPLNVPQAIELQQSGMIIIPTKILQDS